MREKQENLWGKQNGLEPQRSDLWYVDLDNALTAVESGYRAYHGGDIPLPKIFPQYVQSVTFPNHVVKADVYRQGSVPFNMPSWDEPLEAMKVLFVIEQRASGQCATLDFLRRWQALVRLGRRASWDEGRYGPAQSVNGESDFPVFTFDFSVHLLRGGGPRGLNSNPDEIVRQNQSDTEVRSSWRRMQDALKVGRLFKETFATPLSNTSSSASISATRIAELTTLQFGQSFLIKQAWLSSYRLSELAHTQPNLMTIEAQIYPTAVIPTPYVELGPLTRSA